jgi:hypothetical protein
VTFQTPLIEPGLTATIEPTSISIQKESPAADVGSLTITHISSRTEGEALLEWQAEGDFLQGFKILWSKNNANPSFPQDPFIYIKDPDDRSVLILGDPGEQYYYRICKYDGRGCSFYSNAYTYTFDGTAKLTAARNKLSITNISNQSLGKALISWDANGSFPNGFKIVWSSSSGYPVFPGDDSLDVSESNSRSAVVSGTPGTLYYFRVCHFTGRGCDSYSQSFHFSYTGDPASP